MRHVVRWVAYPLMCTAAAGLLAGCSRPKPKTDEFRGAISQTTPGYSIKDLRCESFANKSQEKSGRASCSGTLAIMSDLFSQASPGEVQAALVGAGIPSAGASFFHGRHPKSVFSKTVSQGATTAFTSECGYSGNVDGWNITCSTNYNRFAGQPLETTGSNSVVKDTPEYAAYVNEVLADHRALDAEFKVLKSQVERFFGKGRSVSTTHPIRATMTTPLLWNGDAGFLGYPGLFYMETKYQDLRDNTSGTFCGYPKGAPRDDLLISGGISFNSNAASQAGAKNFVAYVEVMDRNALFQNRYFGCGSRLNWNGTTWKGTLNPGLELRSQ